MKKTLLAAALALAACTPDFEPASKVDRLRVLAVRAEHPEIDPAGAAAPDATSLGALVVRADFASDPARATTVVYVACVPAPGDPAPTPCVALASLRDPTAALASAAEASCSAPPAPGSAPPIAFAGVEACDAVGSPCTQVQLADGTPLPTPAIALPAGYGFDALPAGSRDRIIGVQAVSLAFALDATPAEIVEGATGACPLASVAARFSSLWSSREHVLSVKRIQIRGPEAPDDVANVNPAVDGIAASGTPLAPSPPTALPASDVDLTPVLSSASEALVQTYWKLDGDGVAIELATEDWVYSWFGTAGEMEDLHTRDPAAERWKLTAADAGSSGRGALVAAVVRDLRGGVAWTVREVWLQP